MRFTMAQPEVSCHPETLLEGARTVVSAAYCYFAPEPPLSQGAGRLARYTWHDGYAVLRERLDELGRRLGGEYRVLVDANQHVDREAAARSGVGFYGKNTMLITRRHGSWVVLGTLVTTAAVEATPPLELDCGSCTLCIDACPTGALDEPGLVDSTKCLSYWTQAPAPIPEDYRAELGAQIYGCDICQDVCPWNRGVEKRRADEPVPVGAEPHVRLADWLEGDGSSLTQRYDRLYVPKNEPRFLQRNALVALGNTGGVADLPLADPFLESDDELYASRRNGRWRESWRDMPARASSLATGARDRGVDRARPSPCGAVRRGRGRAPQYALSGRLRAGGLDRDRRLRRRRRGLLLRQQTRLLPAVGLAALIFDASAIAAFALIYSYEYGSPTRWALIFVVVEGALRYGLIGATAVSIALFPFLVLAEWWRSNHFGGPGFLWDRVTFPFGVFLVTGLIVGWLVTRLRHEAAVAEARAGEAETLRDQLGRRVDVLEATNRCARALGSSLEVDQAFGAFIRELRGLIDFDRVTIVLVEGGRAEVMAVAGRGTDTVFPPGSARPVRGSVLEEVLEGKLVYRPAMEPDRYPEEEELPGQALQERLLVPYR